MSDQSKRYELPIDSEEARRMLYGVVMICEEGEEWYDYDDDPSSGPTSPSAPSKPPAETK